MWCGSARTGEGEARPRARGEKCACVWVHARESPRAVGEVGAPGRGRGDCSGVQVSSGEEACKKRASESRRARVCVCAHACVHEV